MALGGGTIVRTAWARARLFSQLPLPAPCLKYAAQPHSVILQRSLLSSSPCLSHPASGASAPGHFTHTQPPVGLSRWRHQQARVSIHHDILVSGVYFASALWLLRCVLRCAPWSVCSLQSLSVHAAYPVHCAGTWVVAWWRCSGRCGLGAMQDGFVRSISALCEY